MEVLRGFISRNDKLSHFLAGFAVCLTTFLLCRMLRIDETAAALVGCFCTLVSGLSKEVGDWKLGRGTFCLCDAVTTLLGGLIATTIILLLTNLF